jgi:hypothetical protein
MQLHAVRVRPARLTDESFDNDPLHPMRGVIFGALGSVLVFWSPLAFFNSL